MARIYETFRKQRVNRRRFLGATAVGAAGAAVVACTGGGGGGGENGAPIPNPNETPTVGGILKQRQNFPYPSLSPFGLVSLLTSGLFGFTTYDHLWYVPIDTGEVVPFLAEDDGIEVVDPEGLQVNVTIREAFYHDKPPVNGRQVLASDVPPSWARFRDDPFGLGREWLRNIMESVEATGERTLVIKQNRPFAWMFGSAAAGSAFSSSVLPVEIVDDDDFLNRDVIGSGRFVLDSHRNGENLKFRPHPRWRVPGEPFLGGIDYSLITEPTAALAQFRAGNLDTVGFANKIEADQMKDRLGDDIVLTSELSRAYTVLMMKVEPPFDDERVRHGINLAVNRQELIQAVELDPEGGRVTGIVPPAQELYALDEDDEAMQEYLRHDTEAARALLEKAGFPFDREFTLKFPSGEEMAKRAQVLKEQLGRAGVNIRLEDQDLLTVWLPRTLNQGEFEMTLFTHLPYEDAYLPLAFYTDTSPIGPQDPVRGRNNMGFFDDEVIAAADAAARELELEPRIEKVKEAQRVIIRKWGPMLNLYSSVSFGARWHWFKGVVTGRGSFGLFNGRAWIDTGLRGS
jgi:peptide/nickel transport system substrate-binding protein